MQADELKNSIFMPMTVVCAAALLMTFIAGTLFIKRDFKPYMKYKSKIEIDAKVGNESGFEWYMLDESMPKPKKGDHIKIISLYQPANYRNTNLYKCNVICFDGNVPTGYASQVDLTDIVSAYNYFGEAAEKDTGTVVTFHRGLSEYSFLTILVMIISTAVYAFFNLPALYRIAHGDIPPHGKIRNAVIVNGILTAVAVIEILLFL